MSLPNPYIGITAPDVYDPWEPTTEWVSFQITAGRQIILDTYGAMTGEVVFHRTTANASNLDAIRPGWIVEIYAQTAFVGQAISFTVTDIVNQYSATPNADYTVITLEGVLAAVNRAALNNYNLASDTIGNQILDVEAESGVAIASNFGTLSDPNMDSATVTSVADWLQKAVLTVNARMDDSQGLTVLDKYISDAYGDWDTADAFIFTDGTVALTSGQIGIEFDQLEFTSMAQNYFTRAIVDPDGHAAQVQTAAGAVEPYRVLSLATFNYNTAQAADYAEYLVSTFSNPQFRPALISVNGQSTNADKLLPNLGAWAIGKTAIINIRGTSVNCIIEGWSVTADASQSRYTFYVSGADLNAYLILDDADRGQLDYNRLGY